MNKNRPRDSCMKRSQVRLIVLGVCVLLLALIPAIGIAQTNGWIGKANTPTAGGYGEAVVGTGDYIYVTRCLYASSTPNFWRYDPAMNTWDTMTVSGLPTGALRNGAALVWDHGDYIYALLGARYTDNRYLFYRYIISSNGWEQLSNTPHKQGAGDALVWSGYDGYIYATLGSNEHGTTFARYDVIEDSWETLSLNPSWTVTDDGASLVWTGGEYLYALRGEWEESIPCSDFARYHIPTRMWQDMNSLPDPGGVGDGASMLWIGNWLSEYSDYIFTLGGGAADESPGYNFYGYSISDGSWQQLESIPCPVGNYVGNRLGFANGHIYYWQGSPTTSEWICGGKAFHMFVAPTPTPTFVDLNMPAGINVDPVAFNLVYYDGVEVTLPTGTEPPELIAVYYYDPVALELLYYFPGWPSLMTRLEHGKVYLVIVSDACQWPIPQP